MKFIGPGLDWQSLFWAGPENFQIKDRQKSEPSPFGLGFPGFLTHRNLLGSGFPGFLTHRNLFPSPELVYNNKLTFWKVE